jgi:hypothetical protein
VSTNKSSEKAYIKKQSLDILYNLFYLQNRSKWVVHTLKSNHSCCVRCLRIRRWDSWTRRTDRYGLVATCTWSWWLENRWRLLTSDRKDQSNPAKLRSCVLAGCSSTWRAATCARRAKFGASVCFLWSTILFDLSFGYIYIVARCYDKVISKAKGMLKYMK